MDKPILLSGVDVSIAQKTMVARLQPREFCIDWKFSTCGKCDFWQKLTLKPGQMLKAAALGECFGGPITPLAISTPTGVQFAAGRPQVESTQPACGLFYPAEQADKLRNAKNAG